MKKGEKSRDRRTFFEFRLNFEHWIAREISDSRRIWRDGGRKKNNDWVYVMEQV